MSAKALTKRVFYETYLKNQGLTRNTADIVEKIERYVRENNFVVTTGTARTFMINFKRRWVQCHRIFLYFEVKCGFWLNGYLYYKQSCSSIVNINDTHRRIPFAELSYSQKWRRSAHARKENVDTLVFAASSSLKRDGNYNNAKLFKEVLKSPSRVKKILDCYEQSKIKIQKKMNGDEALKFSLDCELTKVQYLRIRKNGKERGADIYPSYQELCAAKNCCYPEDIVVNENYIYCPLQSLLDHTASRLMLCLGEEKLCGELMIIYKLGFDGSSGQAEFKHIAGKGSSDSSVYITTIVPIRIVQIINESIVWQNPCPSSTRYCRPVRICYQKENVEAIKEEHTRLKNEIDNLHATHINFINLKIEHKLLLTMLDGKSVNAIEDIKVTQMCYICKATSKNMNDINRRHIAAKLGNVDILKYGLSPLHARIKCMEFILKLAYRLDLPLDKKQKGVRLSPLEKQIVENRKKRIQNDFRSKLNLVVDVPKQGFGSSNDGNCARRFFEHNQLIAEITGIQHEVVYRFYVILTAINSSHTIDPVAFENYTLETINILLMNYNWWTMSPTVHKVLMHGHEIISRAISPVGKCFYKLFFRQF